MASASARASAILQGVSRHWVSALALSQIGSGGVGAFALAWALLVLVRELVRLARASVRCGVGARAMPLSCVCGVLMVVCDFLKIVCVIFIRFCMIFLGFCMCFV